MDRQSSLCLRALGEPATMEHCWGQEAARDWSNRSREREGAVQKKRGGENDRQSLGLNNPRALFKWQLWTEEGALEL